MADDPNPDLGIPMHLRQPPHLPPDQDCDDFQKIVVTPVYRGRLEESHERTRRAWRRRPWYVSTYNRWTRDATAFMENNGQTIFAGLTYLIGGIMVIILLGVAAKMVISSKKRVRLASSPHGDTASSSFNNPTSDE